MSTSEKKKARKAALDTLLAGNELNMLSYMAWQELHPEEDDLPLNEEQANQRITEGRKKIEEVFGYANRKLGGKRRTRRGNKSTVKHRRRNTRRKC